MCRAVHSRLLFNYLYQNLLNSKKHLALVLKKTDPCSYLCILNYFQLSSQHFLYITRMNQKYANDTMFYYYKDMDENLAWLIQKNEEKKVIENFAFPTHRVNMIEM